MNLVVLILLILLLTGGIGWYGGPNYGGYGWGPGFGLGGILLIVLIVMAITGRL